MRRPPAPAGVTRHGAGPRHCREGGTGAAGILESRAPVRDGGTGYPEAMFFFFSNRIGCVGSLIISAVATVVLILIFTR